MINLDYDYLDRIRRAFALQTRHRTTNLLDGSFKSVYRGKSLDFDDLKEYTPGDDVRDIDWPASSRTGRVLVRRYISDRKINALFVLDAGPHMHADTSAGASKDELALMTFGSLAYALGRQGADFAACYPEGDSIHVSIFASGPMHLEHLLYDYERALVYDVDPESLPHGKNKKSRKSHEQDKAESPNKAPSLGIADVLSQLRDLVHKRMAVFVITDTRGLTTLNERICKNLTADNDLYIIHLEDAYFTGDHVYDVRNGGYIHSFLSRSKALRKAELAERERIYGEVKGLTRTTRTGLVTIRSEDEIIDRALELVTGRGES